MPQPSGGYGSDMRRNPLLSTSLTDHRWADRRTAKHLEIHSPINTVGEPIVNISVGTEDLRGLLPPPLRRQYSQFIGILLPSLPDASS